MAYASYGDYTLLYGGSRLTEAEFNQYLYRAGDCLELLTYGRCGGSYPQTTADAVKKACCALVEELARQEREPELESQSVGQWSRTYAHGKSREGRLGDAARLQLKGTGLLWRGWKRDGV